MADTIRTACPSCGKVLQVPASVAGKTIRCKACQATFPVRPAGEGPPAKPMPAKAAPVKPKPAGADAAAPLAFAPDPPAAAAPGQKVSRPYDDDGPDDANPYGVTKDELDIPRCPFCANELDPPDTKVCLTCGYDLLERKRHQSKKVYELSNMEYFKHWLPGIVWLLAAAGALAVGIVFWLNMEYWLDESFLQNDEKDAATLKKTWIIEPLCFNIFTWLICIFVIQQGVRFGVRRLVYNWRPEETVKK